MSADNGQAAAAWVTIVVTLGIAIVGWSQAIRSERRANTADAHTPTKPSSSREPPKREQTAWNESPSSIATSSGSTATCSRTTTAPCPSCTSAPTPAYDVVLTVDPIGSTAPRRVERFGTIEPTQRVGINLTTLAQEAAEEVHGTGLEPSLSVRATISWASKEGVPDVQTWDSVAVI